MLDHLADSGVLLSTEDVFEELKVQDDEVLRWARSHGEIFLALDEETQTEARNILATHANLIDLKTRRSGADPFVIASAITNGCAVVTEERPSGGPHRSKIPDVCRVYGIDCIPVLEMLRREGLKL